MVAKQNRNDFAARLRASEQLWAERAEKEREAWLRRPRLHTAVFEEVWKDEEYARQARLISSDVKISNPGAEERRRKLDAISKKLGWSNERLASFQKLIVEYRRSSSVAAYLEIRRAFPEVEIKVSRFGGIDFAFAFDDELKRLQIPPQMVAAALDCDEPSVDALCLCLLALLVERDALPKSGVGHIEKRRAAISDAMINYLICVILEGYDWHDDVFRVPASLVVLMRQQLSGGSPDLYKAQRAKDKRHWAAYSVAQRLDAGERLSVRGLAKMLAIPSSTAGRWLADKEFNRSVEAFRHLNQLSTQKRPIKK